MPEDDAVILEQGSPEALKMAKAMSSATAGTLLNLLSEEPMTATALAEQTGIPLTTIKYHLENLLDAGLIEVADIRWSEKGRQMKIYRAVQKDIILTQKKHVPPKKLLERYGIAAGILTACCAAVPLFSRAVLNTSSTSFDAGLGAVSETLMAAPVPEPVAPVAPMAPEYAVQTVQTVDVISQIDFWVIVFFLAALGILILLFIISFIRSRRE